MTKLRLQEVVLLALALLLLLATGITLLPLWFPWLSEDPRRLATLLMTVGLPLILFFARQVTAPLRQGLQMLDDGLQSVADGDYSLQLTPVQQPEIHGLIAFYNQLVTRFKEERGVIYQKEIMLETVVQNAPMGILLTGPSKNIILANNAAREMILPGKPLTGLTLAQVTEQAPDALREALASGRDSLFSIANGDETETYNLAQIHFHLNGIPHHLVLLKRLTRELQRQEVEIWKKLIRLINHELNNTLGPLRSLSHSARILLKRDPIPSDKLTTILDTMDQTSTRLQRFLEDYAAFARLPKPRPSDFDLKAWLVGQAQALNFQLDVKRAPDRVRLDMDQMDRVLQNLVKNAHEASPPDGIVEVSATKSLEGTLVLTVADRGRGLSSEAMEKALLPFYSTKDKGTGLGLPLTREIIEAHGGTLRIQHREKGGTRITCILPNSIQNG